MTVRTFTDDEIRGIASRLRILHNGGHSLPDRPDLADAADAMWFLYNEVGALRTKEAAVRAYAERNRYEGGSVGEDIHRELVEVLGGVAW